jgi:hypothetical protein
MGASEGAGQVYSQGGSQRYLSWGCTVTIWLAYLLTKGDHRKVSVEHYISGMCNTSVIKVDTGKFKAYDYQIFFVKKCQLLLDFCEECRLLGLLDTTKTRSFYFPSCLRGKNI